MWITQSVTIGFIISLFGLCNCFKFFPVNREIMYEFVGTVNVGAQDPMQSINGEHSLPTGWKVRGTLKLQRISNDSIAAALAIEKVILTFSGDVFYQNKEMLPLYNPFLINMNEDDIVKYVQFKENDVLWSKNFKRGLISALQVQGNPGSGAFVINEPGLNGQCRTEYFIRKMQKNHLSIRKIPELRSCDVGVDGVHNRRFNVLPNLCDSDYQKNVVTGNEALYELIPLPGDDKSTTVDYLLNSVDIRGVTLINTFESTGEAQTIISELNLKYLSDSQLVNTLDVTSDMQTDVSSLLFVQAKSNDSTDGRQPLSNDELITKSIELLNVLVDSLEGTELNFNEPYDDTVVEVIKVIGMLDYGSLMRLHKEVELGTSYRQETVNNIFLEIIPRVGTHASVIVIKELIIKRILQGTTAIKLLISMPFSVHELSYQLVKDCEEFMSIGPDRPDIKQAALLAYSTLIHHTYSKGAMLQYQFHNYVKQFFELFLSSSDYEQKFLYLQCLANLELENVADYLDPIIADVTANENIRSLAIWATMNMASKRPEKVYEIYWPIFESRNSSIELRVGAFWMLLISNPSPARLMSLHRVVESDKSQHLKNFYQTTIASISGTTYPCYQNLKRLLSYVYRHLSGPADSRFWVTGNYIFDYRDSKYGIGAMLHAMLIGDAETDLPLIAHIKFDTEALGKFTGQLGLFIKARGLPSTLLNRLYSVGRDKMKINDLEKLFLDMKLPTIQKQSLHLEFLFQIEQKAVLVYHLNNRAFNNVTEGDLLKRINALLMGSHINMQTVRWPFMTKYTMPTVLGTPSEVALETTMFHSLRGNTTRNGSNGVIHLNNQIDIRHHSYAVCKSMIYNPFLNFEHITKREQGFLLYAPINNQINIDIQTMKGNFSFYRPANLTSGLALKARSLSTTKGSITRTSAPYSEKIPYHDSTASNLQMDIFNKEIPDLGLNITASTYLMDPINHFALFLKSDIRKNVQALSSDKTEINTLLMLASIVQLNTIHIGNNKKFMVVLRNNEESRLTGAIETELTKHPFNRDAGGIDMVRKFNFKMEHSADKRVHHRWEIGLKSTDYHNTDKASFMFIFKRIHLDNDEWNLCLNINYVPFVFNHKPHLIECAAVFGKDSINGAICPKNNSRIDFVLSADIEPFTFDEASECSKDLLKFNPPLTYNNCTKSLYTSKYTPLRRFNATFKFAKMPEVFELWINKADHLMSSLAPKKIEHLNLAKGINGTLKLSQNSFKMDLTLNDNHFETIFSPLLLIDSKYNTDRAEDISLGFIRSCSLISNQLKTFHDLHIDVKEQTKNKKCPILLVGDCSVDKKFAIFVNQSKEDETRYDLIIYTGGIQFEVYQNNGEVKLFNAETKEVFDIEKQSYQYPQPDGDQFRANINEEGILELESETSFVTIEFNMKDILSIHYLIINVGTACGLCSLPINQVDSYTHCPLTVNSV